MRRHTFTQVRKHICTHAPTHSHTDTHSQIEILSHPDTHPPLATPSHTHDYNNGLVTERYCVSEDIKKDLQEQIDI